MNRAVVIAHFHSGGLIQANLRALMQALRVLPARIVFVSTSASREALGTLPAGVQAIVRPNIGYDFESYRIGIATLGDLAAFDELVLLNSSLVYVDARKLCERFLMAPRPDADIFGLTGSRELVPHLQSFLVAFSKRVLASTAFAAWWDSLDPVNDRDEVIGRYEIGMSAHFARHGFRLAAAFHPTRAHQFRALCRHFEASGEVPPITADGKVTLDVNAADALNPTHFLWDAILEEFGVIKADLLRQNPYSLDLRRVSRMLLLDPAFRDLVADVLAEPAPARPPTPAP
ncbi:MAG TPA: rhamnan synthesis F family protein [Usitatibacter sp.]|jgi:rhamnosyltransferase|nr:rhamnan synthesis F family protein [Usitatibacter sp.]